MISDTHVATVCRLGAGQQACSFMAAGPDPVTGEYGMLCVKTELPALLPLVEQRRELGTMNAMGDNCPGWEPTMKPEQNGSRL